MELTWPMKLRIAAAATVGVLLIGILAWPIAEPFGAVKTMDPRGAVVLVVLAFAAGFIGYFVSWPFGREIGILAAPAGLAIWAVRSGSMAGLIQLNPTVAQRQVLVASLKWEPFFWLAIVAAGFIGVLLGQKLCSNKNLATQEKTKLGPGNYLNSILAVVCSAFIAQFCIRIVAQDVSLSDNTLGSVVAQPAVGQIVFAVLVSFGAAAFVAKKFLDVSYTWPAIASAFVTTFIASVYAKQVPDFVQSWPAAFFPNSVISILPIQMVAFGALGSVAGYWMAIRYEYWRKHEMK
jgi:hypothetical protein